MADASAAAPYDSDAAPPCSTRAVEPPAPPLLIDLYELTMAQVYFEREMLEEAVFELFTRSLPPRRNFLLNAGLDDALGAIASLRFDEQALAQLERLGLFGGRFLDALAQLRFTGSVWAAPEGAALFPMEPALCVHAPLPQAQLLESVVMNQAHFQTLIASKAVRVVLAAQGRSVVDFGLRRAHGVDAALKAARACAVAGVTATSNVLAAQLYDMRAVGTMAHAFVEAFDSEEEAFEAFLHAYGEQATLLVDTYDTKVGVERAIRVMRRLGLTARALRLDSGDLASLARFAREALDRAGLRSVRLVASGGLDEDAIDRLVRIERAPLDGFGVGTRMDVSADAPALDMAYKLTQYAGRPRRKRSEGKATLPGAKQVWRCADEEGVFVRDVLALRDEPPPEAAATPLLQCALRDGRRVGPGLDTLETIRQRAGAQLAKLPERLKALSPAKPPYPVELSPGLAQLTASLSRGAVPSGHE